MLGFSPKQTLEKITLTTNFKNDNFKLITISLKKI